MYICIVVNSEEGSRCLVMLISDPDKKSIRDWFGVINDRNVQASGSLSCEIFGAVVSNGLDAQNIYKFSKTKYCIYRSQSLDLQTSNC